MFFVEVGEKTLSLKHVALESVPADEGAHPVLDNLSTSKPGALKAYRSFSQCREAFLEQFPAGFQDERFLDLERDYKVVAHELARDLLSREAMSRSIAAGEHEEVCRGALQIVNKTNLMFPNEKMALRDGLRDPQAQQAFVERLHDLLHGDGDLHPRFEAFANFLIGIGAGKWPTTTYLPFILHPEQHMFVKPVAMQRAAETCGFDIAYRTEPNWLTYSKVLEVSRYMWEELADLGPRDMLDVQSFLWCIETGQSG